MNKLEERFERLWNAYDKKIGKFAALKAYKRLTEEERKKILPSVVEKYKLYTPEKRYRKNLSTWLNQKCWEDEYELTRDQEIEIYQKEKLKKLRNGEL